MAAAHPANLKELAMSTARVLSTSLALFGLTALAVHAGPPPATGVPSTPGSAIVGTWEMGGGVAPCGAPVPPTPIRALVTFHAGGTLTETNDFPLAGNPSPWGLSSRNGPGLGSWNYDRRTDTYTYRGRFYWWVDGVYHGYQELGPNVVALGPDGKLFLGEIRAARWVYDPVAKTHTKAVEFCGEHTARRI